MTADLGPSEKTETADTALQFLRPVLDKYEITDELAVKAMVEAFQSGIRFWKHITDNVLNERVYNDGRKE